jgi:hypothetical protein
MILTVALLATSLPVSLVAANASQQSGTIRITLRGCPDGPINRFEISLDLCDIPLDAPDASVVHWTEGGGARLEVATDVERDFDGTYVVEDVPAGAEVSLNYFQPVAHNFYEFIGVDDNFIDGPWTGRITMVPGVTRELIVFYWNGAGGFSETAQSTLELRLRGCPEGVDPRVISDPSGACTVPLDAPANARLVWTMEGGALVANQPRLSDGTYRIDGIPPFITVGLAGFEPELRDGFVMTGTNRTRQGIPEVDLYRGETVRIDVFYYYEEGGGDVSTPESGTIDITLRGCRDGIDPTAVANPAAECTIPLDAPEMAGVIWGGDGQGGLEVHLAPRLHDGTYHLENIPSGVAVALAGFEPSVRDSFLVTGDVAPTVNADVELWIEPGASYQVYVWYFDAP